MRKLEQGFVDDLKTGYLSSLLDAVKADDTLCLEIRNNYINIYYRGGSLYRITKPNKKYLFKFDPGYTKHDNSVLSSYSSTAFQNLKANINYSEYVRYIPTLKTEMDLYFGEHPNKEREAQQLVLRENTYSGRGTNDNGVSKDTDYFIVDMEYSDENICRFDMVAVKWPSTSSDRKTSKNTTLALIEMKYADGSLNNKSGIEDHFKDMYTFINSNKFNNANCSGDLYDETETVFNQKMDMGLIHGTNKKLSINRTIKPEYIILIANHKPASKILYRELDNANKKVPQLKNKMDIKIAFASTMGYGLYIDRMIDIDDFLNNMVF